MEAMQAVMDRDNRPGPMARRGPGGGMASPLRQKRFYWGVVLKAISEQARLGGRPYAAEAWHELFKRRLLGYEVRQVAVAGVARKRVVRRLRSTAALSVRAMSAYLEQVQAVAAEELAVRFVGVGDWRGHGQDHAEHCA